MHNTSVMGAVASCGLQLYQFGYTVSIPLFEGSQDTEHDATSTGLSEYQFCLSSSESISSLWHRFLATNIVLRSGEIQQRRRNAHSMST